MKQASKEQGYEVYDPSPNYSAKTTSNVHDDEEDDINVNPNAGQNLLSRPKSRQKQPTIVSLSSSMPDEVIGQPPSSALHPSTASAASSNASSKTGKYHGLKAAADFGNNVTAKFRSILFNTHKRSGSNASYKSTSSNPKSTTTNSGAAANSGSSNNLTRGGRGNSMSGQNLGTIESGGSGSAGSYGANTQVNTPKIWSNVSITTTFNGRKSFQGWSCYNNKKTFKENSSSSSTVSSDQESDDDEDVPLPKGMKSDRIPLSRSSSKDRNKKNHLIIEVVAKVAAAAAGVAIQQPKHHNCSISNLLPIQCP
ncbi:Insulin-like receptor [Eumeta japonica]|uniref:Insulin-like receptor n=1 Tax=Eumeta variegata TaxID=151549 RepID=A0A4C2A3R1_EUMVA|nr:Insulin-like receptor [Eumeta japonica]